MSCERRIYFTKRRETREQRSQKQARKQASNCTPPPEKEQSKLLQRGDISAEERGKAVRQTPSIQTPATFDALDILSEYGDAGSSCLSTHSLIHLTPSTSTSSTPPISSSLPLATTLVGRSPFRFSVSVFHSTGPGHFILSFLHSFLPFRSFPRSCCCCNTFHHTTSYHGYPPQSTNGIDLVVLRSSNYWICPRPGLSLDYLSRLTPT